MSSSCIEFRHILKTKKICAEFNFLQCSSFGSGRGQQRSHPSQVPEAPLAASGLGGVRVRVGQQGVGAGPHHVAGGGAVEGLLAEGAADKLAVGPGAGGLLDDLQHGG